MNYVLYECGRFVQEASVLGEFPHVWYLITFSQPGYVCVFIV